MTNKDKTAGASIDTPEFHNLVVAYEAGAGKEWDAQVAYINNRERQAVVDALEVSGAAAMDIINAVWEVVAEQSKRAEKAEAERDAAIESRDFTKDMLNQAENQMVANSRLAAPFEVLSRKALDILRSHILPDGLSDKDALTQMYEIFDNKDTASLFDRPVTTFAKLAQVAGGQVPVVTVKRSELTELMLILIEWKNKAANMPPYPSIYQLNEAYGIAGAAVRGAIKILGKWKDATPQPAPVWTEAMVKEVYADADFVAEQPAPVKES